MDREEKIDQLRMKICKKDITLGPNKKSGERGWNVKPYTYFTPEKKQEFLEHFSRLGEIQRACDATGITHQTYRNHIKRDPDFRQRSLELKERRIKELELEAYGRAVDGTVKKEYVETEDEHGNIRYVRKETTTHSDPILMFLLKSYDRERFGDQSRVVQEVTSHNESLNVTPEDLQNLDPDSIQKLRDVAESLKKMREEKRMINEEDS